MSEDTIVLSSGAEITAIQAYLFIGTWLVEMALAVYCFGFCMYCLYIHIYLHPIDREYFYTKLMKAGIPLILLMGLSIYFRGYMK